MLKILINEPNVNGAPWEPGNTKARERTKSKACHSPGDILLTLLIELEVFTILFSSLKMGSFIKKVWVYCSIAAQSQKVAAFREKAISFHGLTSTAFPPPPSSANSSSSMVSALTTLPDGGFLHPFPKLPQH